jgi:hypothetical protein
MDSREEAELYKILRLISYRDVGFRLARDKPNCIRARQ